MRSGNNRSLFLVYFKNSDNKLGLQRRCTSDKDIVSRGCSCKFSVMIETRLWAHEYKTACQMDISDAIFRPSLHQRSSRDIRIANLGRALTYHYTEQMARHCHLISSVACCYKIELAPLLHSSSSLVVPTKV